jgi:nucleoside-diphosphate-sugar epimerase
MLRSTASRYSLFADDLDAVLDHTRRDFGTLQGKRLFLTGGTGFFGMWLVETFLKANESLSLDAKLVVLSRDPAAFLVRSPHLAERAGLEFHQGDVRDFNFPAGPFSHVIHAATEASAQLNEGAPARMFDVIVSGTQRAIDFSVSSGVEKVLLVSSGAVYGPQPPEMTHVSEEYRGGPDPLAPASAYGEGKRVAEMQAAIAARNFGLDTSIARCFAFVGPYLPLDRHFAVGNFLRDSLAGNAIQIKNDGRVYRSYLYAADLAIWLWTILFRGASCRPYNVGSDRAVSILEVAQAAAAVADKRLEVRVGRAPDLTAPVSAYVPSNERARRELGLQVLTSLETAMARTFRWHRQKNAPITREGS